MQTIINWLNNALGWVFGFLPDSPFQSLLSNTPVAEYLGYVAYFVDISFIINAFNIWLAAIAVYYIYMAVLRWVKAIGDN
jgi:hypothetical protein